MSQMTRKFLGALMTTLVIVLSGVSPAAVVAQTLPQGIPLSEIRNFAYPVQESAVYGSDTFLRIGLTSRGDRNSIDIQSTELNVGFHMGGYFRAEGTILAGGQLSAIRAQVSYVLLAQNLPSLDEARVVVADFAGSQRATPVLLAPYNWGVYVGPFSTLEEARSAAGHIGGVAVPSDSRRMAITDNGVPVVIFDNIYKSAQFGATSGITAIDSGQYRGVIEPLFQNNRFTAVNIVNIEDYLKSVVPSEMPASWHIQALKAQAVAARTYAITRAYVHEESGFQLCDTIMTQVYRGVDVEEPNSTRAVQETRGIMAFYNGQPINAVYFSSSGGHTENSENVWLTGVPYLRGVPEVAETGYMNWTRTFTLGQLTNLMSANGHNIGSITAVRYTRAATSGRMTELTFVGTNGTRTYRNDAIRSAFRHSADGNLQSTNFTIANSSSGTPQVSVPNEAPLQYQYPQDGHIDVVDVNGVEFRIALEDIVGMFGAEELIRAARGFSQPVTVAPAPVVTQSQSGTVTSQTIFITGRGWGHGAGMSQFGARGMAEAGFTFDQILKHYYTGIEVR